MNVFNWKLFLEELVGKDPINNLQSYIDGMNYSMNDKLFFIDMLNFDVIVDFGCADGTFLKKINSINPNIKLIGYDLDNSMLSKAKSKLGKNSILTNNWDEVIRATTGFKSPLLNLSSVIHEVYSYSPMSDINRFWKEQVFGDDFKFITIRDMIPSVEIDNKEISQFKDDVKKVKSKANKFYLNSFESKWGSINSNYRVFLHFLLKYRFVDNWDREVNENYLPISLELLRSKLHLVIKLYMKKTFYFLF